MFKLKKKVSLKETLCGICQEDFHILKSLSKPLNEAARIGHVKCMKALIQAGAGVNKKDYFNYTPLMNAAANGRVDCLRLLMETGANVNKHDECDYTALVCAAHNGRIGCVKLLLEAGVDVNRQDEDGYIALIYSAEYGHTECVNALIEAGADVNYGEKKYGATALKNAAKYEHIECVKILIEAGADVTRENRQVLLTLATKKAHVDCARLLIKAGADVNLDINYTTALVSAASSDRVNCAFIRMLLLAGVKINYNGNALRKHISSRREPDKEVCLLLFAAGEITNGYNRVPDQYILEFMTVSVLNYALPEDLKHLCRETIRKHLIKIDPHQHLFGRIPQLGLPSSLVKYLLYNMSLDDTVAAVAGNNHSVAAKPNDVFAEAQTL